MSGCACGRELTTGDTDGQCSMCRAGTTGFTGSTTGFWSWNYRWKCPECGSVYAPHIDECSRCNEKATSVHEDPT